MRYSRLGIVAVFLLSGGAVQATDYSWIGQGTGNWSNGVNWLGGSPPPFGGDATGAFIFKGWGSPTTTSFTANNDLGATQFNVLRFDSELTGAGGLTINGSAGNSLQSAGANAEIQQGGLGLVTFGALANLTLNNNLRVGGVGGAADVFGLGNVTFSSAITGGTNTLTVGNGATGNAPTVNTRVVALSVANTFSGAGGVVLDGGNLSIGNIGSLGSGTFTVSANGGTLQTSTSTALSLANMQLNGNLDLIGTTGMTLGTTLLAGSGNLTVRNTSATALTIQSNSSGYSGVVTTDISRLPSQTGTAGVITLNGTSGALTGVSTFNIHAGGGLTISSNLTGSTVNNDRLSDSATVNLRNGTLLMTGSLTAATANTETIGSITGAGYSTVTVTPGTAGAFTALTAGSLSRVDRGTFLFRGTALGSAGAGNVGSVLFTTAPTLTGGGGGAGNSNISILPYAIGDTSATGTGTSFVTYDSFGIRPLNLTTEYQQNSVAGTDANVRLTAATANAGAATVNSLLIGTGGQLTGGGTLNVTSGAVLITGGTAPHISNSLAFGGVEGFVTNTTAATISGNITGANGLTKSGTGALTLTGNNTGLTGQLTINAGTVTIGALNNLAGSGQIVVNGGGSSTSSLNYTGASAIDINRNINIGSGLFSMLNTGAGPVTLSGNISGNGGIYVSLGSSTTDLFLTGNNTYSGITRLFFGRLHINSDAALGTGAFDFGGSTTEGVVMEGNWTTSRHINFSFNSLVNTQSFNAVWNGVVTGTSGIVKAGPGTLTLNAANTNSGAVVINSAGGTVALAQNGTLMSTSYTINNGGKLVLDNAVLPANVPGSGDVVTNRIVDTSTITLASGGTLQLLGNSSQTLTERLGNVTVTGASNIIQVEAFGGQSAVFSIANLTATGGSVLVRGTNLGLAGVSGRVFLTNFNGGAVTNGQFLGNVTAEDLNNLGVIEGAIYDTTFGIRLTNAGDFVNGNAIQNGPPTNLPATANFRVNPSVANPVPIVDPANTINSLRFAPNGVAEYNALMPGTLTITSGSILTEAGGSGAAINAPSGLLTLTSGATQMTISTNANLAMQASIGGTGGVLKQGAGTLTVSQPITNTGTMTLAGGVLAATGAALNGNGNLELRSIAYSGGSTTAGIEFTNTTGTSIVATFNGNLTVANDFRISGTGGGIISSFTNGANDNQTVTLTGVISGGNAASTVRFTGPASDLSTFVLTNPNNSFQGTISVFEGLLAVSSNGALGAAANLVDMNTLSTTVGGMRFDANFTGGNTLTHNVRFNGANVLNTNGNTVEASGVLSDTGTFTKTGAGTLILSNGANTHTGAVNVNAGRLLVNGNLPTSTSAVSVASGATLGGTGVVNRPVTVAAGGTLAPGASIGTLTVGNTVTLNGNSTLGGWDIELNAVPNNTPATAAGAPDVDILALTGATSNLNLVSSASNPLRFNLTGLTTNFDFLGPVNYVIATANAGSNFQTNGGAFNFNAANYQFNTFNFNADSFLLSVDGNRLLLSFNPINPVPEPGTWAMIGLAAAIAYGRRRRRSA